ncbi:MAG: AsmA family protein [Aestuariibacter sp.]
MRVIVKIAGIVLSVVVLVLVLVSSLVSKEDVLAQVSAKVAESTNRQLTVDGEYELRVFPSLLLELNDVKFANFEQGSRPSMASMTKLSLHIPWTSLISGDLNIDRFVIDDLDLLLETTSNGLSNWQMTDKKKSESSTTRSEDASTLPESFDISFGKVQINNGTITLLDHQNQTTEELEGLAIDVQLPSLREQLQVKGKVKYKQQQFSLRIALDTPAQAINGEQFNTEVALESALINVDYRGVVEQNPVRVDGLLDISGDSVKQILHWQGQQISAADNALNQFSLAAQLQYDSDTFRVSDLQFRLDELDIKGQASALLTGIPSVEANVTLGELNLNPYLPEPVDKPEVSDSEESTPIVWDESAIDLGLLSSLNLDLVIAATSLQARDIKLGNNQFTLKLRDSVVALSMDQFNAYKGSGTGEVNLDASSKPYQLDTQFRLSDIDFEPLLTDAVGFDKVLGKGQFQWQLKTSGLSQKDFVEALHGEMSFDVKDGAVKGVNIAAIAKSAANVMSGKLSDVSLDKNFNKADKTDFASLVGSFVFQNGKGTTSDILLLNPLVRVSATGSVNLPETRLDLRSDTRLVSTIEGQGGKVDESGVNIPIKIYGPFHDVKIKPDVSSELKDKVKDKIKDKLKNLFGG